MSFLDRLRGRDRPTGAVGAARASGGDVTVARPSRAEWRSLPVIDVVQRSAGPSVSVDATFGQKLATAHAPSFLDDLGHVVSASAPSGLVTGFTADAAIQADAPAAQPHLQEVPAGTRRVEFGPPAPGTLVTPAPPAMTLATAPMPPVQRDIGPGTRDAVQRHAIEALPTTDLPVPVSGAPLVGAGDRASTLAATTPRPHAAPTGAPLAPRAAPVQRASDSRVDGFEPALPDAPVPDPPLVSLSLQRPSRSDSVGDLSSPAISDEPTARADPSGTDASGRTSPGDDAAPDVVPILSRSPSPLPLRPRIGGPLEPGQNVPTSADTSVPSVAAAPVGSGLDAGPTARTPATEVILPADATVAVQRSTDAPSLAPSFAPSAAPGVDETVAPLPGPLALSRLVGTDVLRLPATAPVRSTAASGSAGLAGGPSRAPVRSTASDLASSTSDVARAGRADLVPVPGAVQRHVAEPRESPAAPVVDGLEHGATFIRPTIGRNPSVSPQSQSPVGRDVPRTVAPAPNSDTASASTTQLQRAPAGVSAAAIPPSIVHAAAWASEVTPLGQAVLDSFSKDAFATPSTPAGFLSPGSMMPHPVSPGSVTADVGSTGAGPFVQRSATPDGGGGTHTFAAASPTSIHAEAEWLPVQTASPVESLASPTARPDDRAGRSPFSGASEADVIGLMRTMYPHLRRRLSRDLLLERDRAGHRTDIRF